MLKKVKAYLDYKQNIKTAKREFVKMAATALPVTRQFSEKTADIARFVMKLAEESKALQGERLIEMILNETAHMLNAKPERLIQVAAYIANLEPEDIKKILVHAMVETSPGTGQED